MRILVLAYKHTSSHGDTTENALRHLLAEYTRRGNMDIDLVTTDIGTERTEDLGGGVRIHYVNTGTHTAVGELYSIQTMIRYAWCVYKKSRDLMRIQPYDFIHAFFSVPCGSVARLLGWTSRIPYIISLRGVDVPGSDEQRMCNTSYCMRHVMRLWQNAAAVVAPSNTMRAHAYALMKQNPREVLVIPDGVDTRIYTPRLLPEGKCGHDRTLVILTAAHHVEHAHLEYVIDAFVRVRERDVTLRAKLIVVGGDDRATHDLRAKARAASLGDADILFVGALDDATRATVYHDTDVVVIPFLDMAMEHVAREALSCGIPVITTHTHGSDIIEDGVTGFLVERQNVQGIVDALQQLIDDPTRIAQMHVAASDAARQQSWDTIASHYEELYYALSQKK